MGKKKALLIILAGVTCVALVNAFSDRERRGGSVPVSVTVPPHAAVDAVAVTVEAPPEPSYAGKVRKNAIFFNLMLACNIPPEEIKEVERASRSVYNFSAIYPGQPYELYTDSAGHIDRLIFGIDEEYFIEINRDNGSLTAERKTYPFELEIKSASGIITQSLFVSLQNQGLPTDLGLKLTDIFAWDIDFFTDVHKNDYFRVIYEEKTRHDGIKKIGNVIAAEFNTRGINHYAFLFENEEDFPDYFDETGRSLRKQLLKAPLSYTRISSNYSRRRFHPVLHRWAPHLGIDYAAPTGTPVMSTGDGTVITASRTKANGKYVKIRHSSNYITYYLHFSRFGKGIRGGAKVKQGQVIGYVGATGYATGPHLDYRVKKNGRFVNPRRLKLPPAKPVSDSNMTAFAALADIHIEHLSSIPIHDWRTQHYASDGKRGNESYLNGIIEESIPAQTYPSH